MCLVTECNNPNYCRFYCRKHYARLKKWGSPLGNGKTRAAHGDPHLFLEQALKYKKPECLTWPYGRHGNGRAMIKGEKSSLVHRIICERINGLPPTPEHQALHLCGNGHLACVSPLHLYWGTHKENMQDMVNHGRSLIRPGELNPSSKLTWKQVEDIRQLEGKQSQKDIGDLFGISQVMAGKILRGESWRRQKP